MATVDCEREIADLRPGEHLLFLHESEAEQREWTVPFLCEGLERGEQVMYALDMTSPETVVRDLQAAGLDAEAYLHSGQLGLLSVREVYFPGGCFDPEAMLHAWDRLVDQALEQGYTGLRVTAEMTWGLRRWPGSRRMLEYEYKVNSLFPDRLFIALCQYDQRRFSAAELLEAIAVHPEVVTARGRHQNLFFSASQSYCGAEVAENLLRFRLECMETRTNLRRALEEQASLAATVLDAVAAMIMILDGEGRVVFLNQAMEQALGYCTHEVKGQTAWELLASPQERDDLRRLLAGAEQDPAPPVFTACFTTREGQPRRLRCTCGAPPIPSASQRRIVITATAAPEPPA